MTCIVGFTDKQNGITYLGGDSLGSNGYSKAVYLQGLEYENLLDETKLIKNEIDRKYLITQFVPNLIRLVSKYNSNTNRNGSNEMDGALLFGYRDRLFKVQEDYSLLEPVDNYCACGSGEYFALGSLCTTEDAELSPIGRIHKALQVASKFGVGIAPPFYIINTENSDIIEFKD